MITDANGAVVKTFATNAFGVRNKAAETGTFELALGFAGGIEDPVTGLVRFGLRDYEPATGRFTAKDPILHEGGMNLFVYAGNNPVSQRDPSGMDEVDPSLLTLPTPGERIVGHFNKFIEWVKSEDGRDTIENIAEIPSENQAIKSVEMLDKGLSAVDFAEDAMAVYEAESQNISLPEQAVAWVKCGARGRRRRAADPAHAGGDRGRGAGRAAAARAGRARRGRRQLRRATPARRDRDGTGEPAMMRRIALLTAAFTALGAGTAMAADITYTGANGAWTTAANWDLNRVPATGDVVKIPSGKQVTLDTPASVSRLELAGTLTGAGELTIGSGTWSGGSMAARAPPASPARSRTPPTPR